MLSVKKALALAAAIAGASIAFSASAQQEQDRAYLPATFEIEPSSHWLVGMAGDFTVDTVDPGDMHHRFILGISAAHCWDWFRLGGKLLMSPDGIAMTFLERGGVENIRSLAGITARAAFNVGSLQMLYGAGFHAEVRLSQHFWMMVATPLELGAVIWRTGSWNIQLFTGLRLLVAGELFNVFVLDPNGFDDGRVCNPETNSPQCDLDRVKDSPWNGFIGLVFARRID